MNKVGFFTPISFSNQPTSPSQSLLQCVDNYFYFGGKKAVVIPGNNQSGSIKTQIVSAPSPSLKATALKIASYFTLVIPVIMLCLKAVLRSTQSFQYVQSLPQTPPSFFPPLRTLANFYETNGIARNPKKPIEVTNLDTLGLNLDLQDNIQIYNNNQEENRIITLREVAQEVIRVINHQINISPKTSPETIRLIQVRLGRNKVLEAAEGLMVPGEAQIKVSGLQIYRTWVGVVVAALVEKGYLFELKNHNGNGYHIQA